MTQFDGTVVESQNTYSLNVSPQFHPIYYCHKMISIFQVIYFNETNSRITSVTLITDVMANSLYHEDIWDTLNP